MFHALSRPSRRRVIAAVTALTFALATSGMPAYAKKKPKTPPANMIPISITDVVVDPLTGGLVAVGNVGGQPFLAPITVSTSPNLADPDCPILNLELGPIHLDLLGLVVDTSAICLRVTAHAGEGLLGDLLCGVAGLLDGGLPLGTVLAGLTDAQLTALLGGITALLDEVFNQLTSSSAIAGASCDILNLSLGPIDLNLLGLQVELDDCDGGPVTLDITAEPGPGNLLGNLLCSLAGLLDGPNPSPIQLARLLHQIAAAIDALL